MSKRHTFNRALLDYEGKGDQGRDPDPHKSADIALAKRIWEVVQYHYPGHPWGVGVNHEQGIAQIFLPAFTQCCYVIRLAELFSDPSMKTVIRGAGELLERFRIPRSGFDIVDFIEAQKRFHPMFYRNRLPE